MSEASLHYSLDFHSKEARDRWAGALKRPASPSLWPEGAARLLQLLREENAEVETPIDVGERRLLVCAIAGFTADNAAINFGEEACEARFPELARALIVSHSSATGDFSAYLFDGERVLIYSTDDEELIEALEQAHEHGGLMTAVEELIAEGRLQLD